MDKKKTVKATATITALCLLGDSMLYITLPVSWEEVGLLSLWEVGILLSVNRLMRLPLNPLVGWLYTRIPLRAGLGVAVLLAGATTAGYGILKGFWPWLFLRCAWGVAWSFLSLGGLLTVIECSDGNNRGELMGKYNGIFRLGSLFGMLLGGFLPGILGLRNLCLIFGLVALTGIFILPPSLNNPASGQEDVAAQPALTRRIVTGPICKMVLSGLLVAFLFRGIFNSTLSYITNYHFGKGITLVGMSLSATALAGLIQAFRWLGEPLLAGRVGRRSDGPAGRLPVFFVSLITAAIGFCILPLSLPLLFWLAGAVLVIVSAVSVGTLMDTLASDVAKQDTRVVPLMTAYSVSSDLGAALGPLVGYFILGLPYGRPIIYFGGAVIFLVILFIWSYGKQSDKECHGSINS